MDLSDRWLQYMKCMSMIVSLFASRGACLSWKPKEINTVKNTQGLANQDKPLCNNG